jgi:NhaP-type Na+/H+ or K+/H+ antiporter
MFLDFVYLLVVSILVGLVIGFTISFIFKKYESLNEHPMRETSVILIFAYLTYCLSEILLLSGIISLFIYGVIMGHYAYHNISEES